MAGKKNGSARLPLIEAVIIIAVFAIVSVAIMRMYVAADSLKGESVAISHATILARNAAEEVKNGGEYDYTRYYDKDWNEVLTAEDVYGGYDSRPETLGARYKMTVKSEYERSDGYHIFDAFSVEVIDLDKALGTKDNPLISILCGRNIEDLTIY